MAWIEPSRTAARRASSKLSPRTESDHASCRHNGMIVNHFAALSIICVIIVAGCTAHESTVPSSTRAGMVIPQVVQQQGSGPWITISMGTGHNVEDFESIVAGFDGAMWVCDVGYIDRVDMFGNVQYHFLQGGGCDDLVRITNDRLFFMVNQEEDGIVDRYGNISTHRLQEGLTTRPTVGDSNGFVWIAEDDGNIAKVDPVTGAVTNVTLNYPEGSPGLIEGLAYGSDGEIWFSCHTATYGKCLGEVALDGSSNQFWLVPAVSNPIAANDRGIWFSEGTSIARMDTGTKTITTYAVPHPVNATWGTKTNLTQVAFVADRSLVVFDIRKHRIGARIAIPNVGFGGRALTLGVDKNLWMDARDSCARCLGTALDVYLLHEMASSPTSITVGVGQEVALLASESGYKGTFTATSSNVAVASVTGGNNGEFVVSGQATGTCTITLTDQTHNSLDVPVTVI